MGPAPPLTLQIISTNIGYFCNADRNLVLHPGISVYDAYHFAKPAPSKYDYRSMNMKQISGNVTTPIVALAHYLWYIEDTALKFTRPDFWNSGFFADTPGKMGLLAVYTGTVFILSLPLSMIYILSVIIKRLSVR